MNDFRTIQSMRQSDYVFIYRLDLAKLWMTHVMFVAIKSNLCYPFCKNAPENEHNQRIKFATFIAACRVQNLVIVWPISKMSGHP